MNVRKIMDLRATGYVQSTGFSDGVGVKSERSKGVAQFLACVTEQPHITALEVLESVLAGEG